MGKGSCWCVRAGDDPTVPAGAHLSATLGTRSLSDPKWDVERARGMFHPGWVRVAGEAMLVTASLASRVLQPQVPRSA